jgi:hypothetical protein
MFFSENQERLKPLTNTLVNWHFEDKHQNYKGKKIQYSWQYREIKTKYG